MWLGFVVVDSMHSFYSNRSLFDFNTKVNILLTLFQEESIFKVLKSFPSQWNGNTNNHDECWINKKNMIFFAVLDIADMFICILN